MLMKKMHFKQEDSSCLSGSHLLDLMFNSWNNLDSSEHTLSVNNSSSDLNMFFVMQALT